MRNPMLELARTEGHQPRHKLPHTEINKFRSGSLNEKRAEQFVKLWRGGPFTIKDISATVGARKNSRCNTASYMVTHHMARKVGKHSTGNATVYELTGVSS